MDLQQACHAFMAAYWRNFETGETVNRSGYIVGGVDIADAVKAVVELGAIRKMDATTKAKDSVDNEMMTDVVGFQYSYETRHGVVFLGEGCCSDMNGCITFFERIDADVRSVKTVSDGEPDVYYLRGPKGWASRIPRPEATE